MAKKTGKKTHRSARTGTKPVRMLTAARVRKLGMDQPDMTSAQAALGRGWDLAAMLDAKSELAAAWDRGRFLRNLHGLAAKGASVAEAAFNLHLTAEDLQVRLNTDRELADIWNQARLETTLTLKGQWLEKAGEGNVRAIAQVEAALRNEIAHAAMDIHTVTEDRMGEICGVTRQTLNRWLREEGMPRNAGETTYDLPAVWKWFEGFTKKRAGGAAIPEADRLRDMKAERIELDLRQRRGELLEVESVKAGLLARERALLAVLEHKPEELAPMLEGKTKHQILPVLEQFCKDLRTGWVNAIEWETTNHG